jgi:hypothetical protein
LIKKEIIAPRTKLDAKSIGMVSQSGSFEKSLIALVSCWDTSMGVLTGYRISATGILTIDSRGIATTGIVSVGIGVIGRNCTGIVRAGNASTGATAKLVVFAFDLKLNWGKLAFAEILVTFENWICETRLCKVLARGINRPLVPLEILEEPRDNLPGNDIPASFSR